MKQLLLFKKEVEKELIRKEVEEVLKKWRQND